MMAKSIDQQIKGAVATKVVGRTTEISKAVVLELYKRIAANSLQVGIHYGSPVLTGRYITYGRYSMIARPAIQGRLDALNAADPDPLDLLPELHLLRALVIDFIERYDTSREALLAWHAAGHPWKGKQVIACDLCTEACLPSLHPNYEPPSKSSPDV
jgi:hypothetical protein